MSIIAKYGLVNADKRDGIVDAHRNLVSRAVTADSLEPERSNSVEVWRGARGDGPAARASPRSGDRRSQVHVGETVRRR